MITESNIRRINTDINLYDGLKSTPTLGGVPAVGYIVFALTFGFIGAALVIPTTETTRAIVGSFFIALGIAALITAAILDHHDRTVRKPANSQIVKAAFERLEPVLANAGTPMPATFAKDNVWRMLGGRARTVTASYNYDDQTVTVSFDYDQPFVIDITPATPALTTARK